MPKKLRELTSDEKELKKKKRKERKESKKNEVVEVHDFKDQEFVDSKGKKVKLLKFLKKEEVWDQEIKRRTDDNKVAVTKKRIIIYDGIKRLAKAAGIYHFTKQKMYDPTIENNELFGFDITIWCNAKTTKMKKDFCRHGYHQTTMLGEASKLNTKSIGEKYKATMAEKRGYVRAVINHLGLVDILGEDELGEPQEIDETPPELKKEEFENLSSLLNDIIGAVSKEGLDNIGANIATKKTTLNDAQIGYLRKVFRKKLSEFEKTEF